MSLYDYPWKHEDPAEAARLHGGYVAGHPERLRRFLAWLDEHGFVSESLKPCNDLAMMEPLWAWLLENPDHLAGYAPLTKHEAQERPNGWWPWMNGETAPPGWPGWFRGWLPTETMDLISGLAAVFTETVIEGYGAMWLFSDSDASFSSANKTFIQLGGDLSLQVEKTIAFDYFYTVDNRFVVKSGEPPTPPWQRVYEAATRTGIYRTDRPERPPRHTVEVEPDEFPWQFIIDIDHPAADNDTSDLVDRYVAALQQEQLIATASREDRHSISIELTNVDDHDTVTARVRAIWSNLIARNP